MASLRSRLIRLLLIATIPLVVVNILAIVTVGVGTWRRQMSDVEAITEVIHRSIDATLHESIVSYLRSKAETARTLVEIWDGDPSVENEATVGTGVIVQNRGISLEGENLSDLRTLLLSLPVADSGYIYVIDSSGEVLVHPDPTIQGTMIPDIEPVKSQLERRYGYLAYQWQNTFEPSLQPKALFMVEYEPRGWIVAATSYRYEFVDLIDRSRLLASVGVVPLSLNAYSVIIAEDGTFVAHPEVPGRNVREFFSPEEGERILSTMFNEKKGRIEYDWPIRPGETRRPKAMYYHVVPDFNWAVATTVHLDAIRRPIIGAVALIVALSIVLVSIVVLVTTRMSKRISDPVVSLYEAAKKGVRSDQATAGSHVPEEIVSLVASFNEFVDRIEEQREEVASREESLQQTLHERTILIREVHHRVKNNLQVIASLLSLQEPRVYDPRDAVLLERSRQRVISMAMVHEQLHQVDGFALVPFADYIDDLVRYINDSAADEPITILTRSDDVYLEIHRAVPCGLIINELVTNAIEHAFDGTGAGTIRVTFADDGTFYTLEVADNGVGLPEAYTRSLGFTLIESLTEQLHGTLSIETSQRDNAGTRVRITIPENV